MSLESTPSSQLDALIQRAFNPSRDLEMVTIFLKHLKTNNLSLQAVNERVEQYADPMQLQHFFACF